MFFRKFTCMCVCGGGALYIKVVLQSVLVLGFTFWESLSCWQESIKAWPIPRVTGYIAARVLESQVWDGPKTRFYLLQWASALTWAQYWDLAAATRSFNTGWDWETRGVTAWMTAVNLEGGFKPEREWWEEPNDTLRHKTRKNLQAPAILPGANVPSGTSVLYFLWYWQNWEKWKTLGNDSQPRDR